MAWFRRGRPDPPQPQRRPEPAGPGPGEYRAPGWLGVPPLQRVIGPIDLVAPTDRFTRSLTSWQTPAMLEPLGHLVDPAGPHGQVGGLARARPTEASRSPETSGELVLAPGPPRSQSQQSRSPVVQRVLPGPTAAAVTAPVPSELQPIEHHEAGSKFDRGALHEQEAPQRQVDVARPIEPAADGSPSSPEPPVTPVRPVPPTLPLTTARPVTQPAVPRPVVEHPAPALAGFVVARRRQDGPNGDPGPPLTPTETTLAVPRATRPSDPGPRHVPGPVGRDEPGPPHPDLHLTPAVLQRADRPARVDRLERVPAEPLPDEPLPDNPVPDDPVADNPVPDNPVPDNPVPDLPVPNLPMPDLPMPDRPVPDEPGPAEPAVAPWTPESTESSVDAEPRAAAEAVEHPTLGRQTSDETSPAPEVAAPVQALESASGMPPRPGPGPGELVSRSSPARPSTVPRSAVQRSTAAPEPQPAATQRALAPRLGLGRPLGSPTSVDAAWISVAASAPPGADGRARRVGLADGSGSLPVQPAEAAARRAPKPASVPLPTTVVQASLLVADASAPTKESASALDGPTTAPLLSGSIEPREPHFPAAASAGSPSAPRSSIPSGPRSLPSAGPAALPAGSVSLPASSPVSGPAPVQRSTERAVTASPAPPGRRREAVRSVLAAHQEATTENRWESSPPGEVASVGESTVLQRPIVARQVGGLASPSAGSHHGARPGPDLDLSSRQVSLLAVQQAPAPEPAPPPEPPTSAEPTTTAATEAAAPPGPAPASAPNPATAAPTAAVPVPANIDLEELTRRLFEPLTARLKTELRLDRERAGVITDLRR